MEIGPHGPVFVLRPGPDEFMWQDFLAALALALVIEGMMPFLSPKGWKEMIRSISQMEDSALRVMGLAVMVVGVVLLYLVRG